MQQIDKIRGLIAAGETEKAILSFGEMTRKWYPEWRDAATLLSGQYRQWKKAELESRIPPVSELRQMEHRILQILSEIERKPPPYRPKYLVIGLLLLLGLIVFWWATRDMAQVKESQDNGNNHPADRDSNVSVAAVNQEKIAPYQTNKTEQRPNSTKNAEPAPTIPPNITDQDPPLTKERSKMVTVPGGMFWMGDRFGKTSDNPLHQVELSAYRIGQHEVTNREYCAFLNSSNPNEDLLREWIDLDGKGGTGERSRIQNMHGIYTVENGYDDFPVLFVSWFGAVAYCKWAGGRLPTEAEWEYSAIGGVAEKDHPNYSGGSMEAPVDQVAWYSGNSRRQVHAVKGLKPNSMDLYDLSGNVAEWCADIYAPILPSETALKNPAGPVNASGDRVIRGGSWQDQARLCQVFYRGKRNPREKTDYIGFRIAK